MDTEKWTKHLNLVGLIVAAIATLCIVPFTIDLPWSIPMPVLAPRQLSAKDLATEYRKGCPQHRFSGVKVLSREPYALLIEEFVTPAEAEFLVKAAEPLLGESHVVDAYGSASTDTKVDKSHRDSLTAFLNSPSSPPQTDEDVVVTCIEQRATRFQGHIPVERLESLQVVMYRESQQFRSHYDWLDPNGKDLEKPGNRQSSFFVYLVANCTGGTTVFPNIQRPQSEEWCDVLKCKDDEGKAVESVEVLPKVGTAIFWFNLDTSGEVDRRTLHAGAPVSSGTKVGMNIWTRERNWRI